MFLINWWDYQSKGTWTSATKFQTMKPLNKKQHHTLPRPQRPAGRSEVIARVKSGVHHRGQLAKTWSHFHRWCLPQKKKKNTSKHQSFTPSSSPTPPSCWLDPISTSTRLVWEKETTLLVFSPNWGLLCWRHRYSHGEVILQVGDMEFTHTAVLCSNESSHLQLELHLFPKSNYPYITHQTFLKRLSYTHKLKALIWKVVTLSVFKLHFRHSVYIRIPYTSVCRYFSFAFVQVENIQICLLTGIEKKIIRHPVHFILGRFELVTGLNSHLYTSLVLTD